MIMILMVGSLALLAVFCTMAVFMMGQGKSEKRSLMADMGLAKNWKGEVTAPFYKWGWKKTSGDRVWGERIVKKAFRNAGIWISPDDLSFFERKCAENSQGKSVKNEEIKERIDLILQRSEVFNNHVSKTVNDLITKMMRASEEEAQAALQEMGVTHKSGSAVAKLTSSVFRSMIRQAGVEIFNPHSKGFKIEGAGDQFYLLNGFDSWCFWLGRIKAELQSELEKKPNIRNHIVGRAVRKNVLDGFIKIYQDDIENSLAFRSNLEQQIADQEINVAMEEIERAENCLFVWQFSDRNQFTDADHRRFRQFMTTKDLAPAFREKTLKTITTDISSAKSLINSLPRNVIFTGDDYESRTFAARAYQLHFKALLSVFGPPLQEGIEPPEVVSVTLDDIFGARREFEQKRQSMAGMPSSKKRQLEDEPGYITTVLDKLRKQSAFERTLDRSIADSYGWLIDYPMGNDILPHEWRELNSDEFAAYKHYSCDESVGVNLQSSSSQAKKKRNEFAGKVIEALVGGGGIGRNRSRFDDASAPAEAASSEEIQAALQADSEPVELAPIS
ncbi:MAG: hypothetical protein GC154_07690 [bacterium]|nr:hypothetical protein [bacterium]